MRQKHNIPCDECGKEFVSDSMLAVHKYLSHDIEYAYCKQACEGQCPKYFGEEIEKVGGHHENGIKLRRQNKRKFLKPTT